MRSNMCNVYTQLMSSISI